VRRVVATTPRDEAVRRIDREIAEAEARHESALVAHLRELRAKYLTSWTQLTLVMP
jgi:hypothetical protein